jgi:hypothetical protein
MIGFVEKSSKKAALACYQFERFVFFYSLVWCRSLRRAAKTVFVQVIKA